MELLDAMKELELDPTCTECFVQRRDDNVAQAGLHLQEQCALVVEEQRGRKEETEPGGKLGASGVAVAVPEHQAVDATDEWRFQCDPGRTMRADPLSVLEVVDRAEAALVDEQAGGDD